jgi:hypothetical protein
MADYTDDAELLKRQRQFLEETERIIRETNREILHAGIPELDQQSFVRLARQVAQLRASYLQAALVKGGTEAAGWAEKLRAHRLALEEGLEAFEALQRAIKRGYVDIGVTEAA